MLLKKYQGQKRQRKTKKLFYINKMKGAWKQNEMHGAGLDVRPRKKNP